MSQYIDGFALPIPKDRLYNYKQLVETVAQIWKEHGALSYMEYVGDDLKLAGTRSFTEALSTTEDEAILFGFVTFESKEARNLANQKVAQDPRMAELMAASNTGFEASRMLYGGFRLFVGVD